MELNQESNKCNTITHTTTKSYITLVIECLYFMTFIANKWFSYFRGNCGENMYFFFGLGVKLIQFINFFFTLISFVTGRATEVLNCRT